MQQSKGKGIYLLPNLLTTFSLFSGFFSIVSAINGNFEVAAIAILLAVLWDGLDGRVARLTHTESAFGEQYDSMADLVSFGVAPALLCYLWSTLLLGRIGWMVAFFYTVATALRLSRFNSQISSQDKNYFQGLPSPAAAAFLASLVWVEVKYNLFATTMFSIFFGWFALILTGLLMVSNIRYYSFKAINLKERTSFRLILIVTLLLVVVNLAPSVILFVAFLAYLLSGVVYTMIRIRQKRRIVRKEE